MKQKMIAKTRYNDTYWLVWSTGFNDNFGKMSWYREEQEELKNDIQVVLLDDEGNKLDDAICHFGSYGVKEGLWEIMSESLPKSSGDNVEGWLTWKQVERYFDKTIRKHRVSNKDTK